MNKARVLYDFAAQPGSGELSICADEILTVTRENVEGGWLEGVNSRGIHGLFPESYVERLTTTSVPPPIAMPSSLSSSGGQPRIGHPQPSPQQPRIGHPQPQPPPQQPQHQSISDDFDDEWTEEEEDEAGMAGEHSAASSRRREPGGGGGGEHGGSSKGTIRMNWFSNFVKSGMEAYIMTGTKMNSAPSERHSVEFLNGRIVWAPIQKRYTCVVDKPKKESKLKGLKSFIAYNVTSSLSGIQVSRRYKHFDWLHDQLSAKYITIPIPPLPEKQVSGRYQEDLVEHRKSVLQLFVNKICRHPVLSQSDVWKHFITCTDEKQWKTGKRRAEKDEYVGGNFFNCVSVPPQAVDHNAMERQLETFSRMTRSLDDSVRTMFDRLSDTHKRMIGQSVGMAMALKRSAAVYNGIGELHDEQTKRDTEPLMDALYAHRGLLQAAPNMAGIYKSAVGKLREPGGDGEAIRGRVDTVAYTLQAEMAHLNAERIADFKTMMSAFVGEQAQFYAKISQQLSALKTAFDEA